MDGRTIGWRVPPALCAVAALLLCTVATAHAKGFIDPGSRDDEPVIVTGAAFQDLLGSTSGQLGFFVYDPGTTSYVPIPFQFDQRVTRTFNEDTPYEFEESMYDVENTGNGQLDEDDELVILYRDAGTQRAPDAIPWPAGAGSVSYEIQVNDPRPIHNATRWVYLFGGSGMPRSPARYVAWNIGAYTPITTSQFELGYTGKWLLTSYRVFAPCGNGTDLIDRFKGRARPLPTLEEDEESWESNSEFMGGIVGPVRAIRYVRGASSGINTIHHDIVYRNYWMRHINLRVHPLNEARVYIDWLPGANRTLFLPTAPNGVAIDGKNDAGLSGGAVPEWSVTRTPGGGAAILYSLPDSPRLGTKNFWYRDDSTYNDRVLTRPNYGDDDDGAYGASGLEIGETLDSNTDAIEMSFRMYPLCANEGSSSTGQALDQTVEYPLQAVPTERHQTLAPVRTLALSRSGGDVVLNWTTQSSATSYVVYVSGSPATPQAAWNSLTSVPQPPVVDPGAAAPGFNRYYSVVAFSGQQPGGW